MERDAEGGIFEEELQAPVEKAPEARVGRNQRTSENMAIVTDPDPRSRVRWQRRKVIQMVRKRGELTQEERIKMTEREHLYTSKFLPTSSKKLVMLARQIAGKSLDDAITQMQWSKKKMAAEVKCYLEEARDLAIARRGMGLGRANGELLEKPQKIQTKDGKWIEITDPTRMYIAQSWVGRGKWRGKSLDYKARASFGIMKHPATSKLIPVLISSFMQSMADNNVQVSASCSRRRRQGYESTRNEKRRSGLRAPGYTYRTAASTASDLITPGRDMTFMHQLEGLSMCRIVVSLPETCNICTRRSW